jgi:O-acetylhomoserine (thiol)-lyase
MTPANDVLEKRVAAIEGGVAALAVSSGRATSAIAVQNLARVGDNIVSSIDLYGGTWNLFANTLKVETVLHCSNFECCQEKNKICCGNLA